MKQTYTLFNDAIITGDNLTGRKSRNKKNKKSRDWFFNKATSTVWTENDGTKTIEAIDPLENSEKRKIDMFSFSGFIVIKNNKEKTDIVKTFENGKLTSTKTIEGAYKNAVEMYKKIVKYLTMKTFYNMKTNQFINLLKDNDLEVLNSMFTVKEKYNTLN